MAKRKRMDQIKSVLRNYLVCGSIKGTARQLKMSKNTVREYLRRAQAHSSDLSELLNLDDEQLHQIFYPSEAQQASHRSKVFDEQVDYWLKELGRVGVYFYCPKHKKTPKNTSRCVC